MVMAGGGVILPEHLPIAPGSGPPPAAAGTLEQLVEQKLAECVHGLGRRESANLYDLLIGLVERPLLRAVLRETGGNQLRAAALLGINRNTLRKKLRQLGLAAGSPDSLGRRHEPSRPGLRGGRRGERPPLPHGHAGGPLARRGVSLRHARGEPRRGVPHRPRPAARRRADPGGRRGSFSSSACWAG